MTSLLEQIPSLAAYTPALVALALVTLITLVQNFLTAPLSFLKEEQVPGMPLRFGHEKLSFRALRTYQNSAESLPPFLAAVALAVVAGAPVGLVNIAAFIYLAARFAFWAIYYSGIGKVAGGPRTMAFVVCLLANIVIGAAALWALI